MKTLELIRHLVIDKYNKEALKYIKILEMKSKKKWYQFWK